DFTGRLWAGGTRALISGLCLSLLCGASGWLVAQTGGQPATAQLVPAQQGAEMVSAKMDALALPDAPVPVAVADFALDSGKIMSSSSSLRTFAQNQPPSSGPSLSDLGLTPADTEGSAARQAL